MEHFSEYLLQLYNYQVAHLITTFKSRFTMWEALSAFFPVAKFNDSSCHKSSTLSVMLPMAKKDIIVVQYVPENGNNDNQINVVKLNKLALSCICFSVA